MSPDRRTPFGGPPPGEGELARRYGAVDGRGGFLLRESPNGSAVSGKSSHS